MRAIRNGGKYDRTKSILFRQPSLRLEVFMVKAFPRAVIGYARLELLNDASANPVTVKNVLVGAPGDGPKYPAIAMEISLAPAQAKTVDLTATVLKVLGANGKGPVQVRLHLNPEQPDQPEPASYFCETAGGRVVQFSLPAAVASL